MSYMLLENNKKRKECDILGQVEMHLFEGENGLESIIIRFPNGRRFWLYSDGHVSEWYKATIASGCWDTVKKDA